MISVILPAYNEAANIPALLTRLAVALGKEAYETIVVDDDSPDRTWEVAEGLKKTHANLTVIRRIGRKGLSSAVVEGFDAAKGDVLAVMDADLQHDPALIADLARAVRGGATIAVASRYIEGGSVGEWVKGRRLLSRFGTFLARNLPPVHVSDPLSGFFAIDKKAYDRVRPHLRPAGFKILLEILSFLPRDAQTAEVPLVFNMREHGESKLSVGVESVFLWQMLRIALRRIGTPLLWIVSVGAAVVLLPRVIALAPLYLDADIRAKVQTAMQAVADGQGWLLSDMSLRRVTDDGIEIVHRAHRNGPDASACVHVPYDSSRILPCAD